MRRVNAANVGRIQEEKRLKAVESCVRVWDDMIVWCLYIYRHLRDFANALLPDVKLRLQSVITH